MWGHLASPPIVGAKESASMAKRESKSAKIREEIEVESERLPED